MIMGIFSNLLGSSSNIEKQLEAQYVPMFETMMNMSPSQAKNTFRGLFKQAKEAALAQGTLNLPQNFGDMLLERESYDEELKAVLAKKRKEGVRDEDIRWWGNMHELERKMMIQVDTWTAFSKYLFNIEQGMSVEDSLKEHRKIKPFYGDPDDTSHTTGEDRPLPYELKDRVNIYIEKRALRDREKFKKDIEKSSSFNALIREEIKKVNI